MDGGVDRLVILFVPLAVLLLGDGRIGCFGGGVFIFVVVVGFACEGDGEVGGFADGDVIGVEDGEVEFDGGVFIVREACGVAEVGG